MRRPIAEERADAVSDAQKKAGRGQKEKKAKQRKKPGTEGTGMIASQRPGQGCTCISNSSVWSQNGCRALSSIHPFTGENKATSSKKSDHSSSTETPLGEETTAEQQQGCDSTASDEINTPSESVYKFHMMRRPKELAAQPAHGPLTSSAPNVSSPRTSANEPSSTIFTGTSESSKP
jgi:hypothetical protein